MGISTATAKVVIGETPTTRVELYSIATESGQVRRDGIVGQPPLAGDTKSGNAVQAFLSFDVSLIPEGATITSASLNLAISDLFGTPFEVLGRLYVFECKYTQLSINDYASGMIMPGALYSTTSLPDQTIVSDALLNAVQTRIASGSNRFQIRVQFEKQQIYRGASAQTYNDLADFIAFNPARTKLTIEYQY
jgi:hypothetical protein